LSNKKTCPPHGAGDICPCSTRGHVFLLNREKCTLCSRKACLLVEQEDMPSTWSRRHLSLFDKKTCPLVEQEEMHPEQQEGMSSCRTRRHAFHMEQGTFAPVRYTYRHN